MEKAGDALGNITAVLGGVLPLLVGFMIIALLLVPIVLPLRNWFRSNRNRRGGPRTNDSAVNHRRQAEEGL